MDWKTPATIPCNIIHVKKNLYMGAAPHLGQTKKTLSVFSVISKQFHVH